MRRFSFHLIFSIAMQGASTLVPLALIPFLSRELGAAGLGEFVFGQTFALVLSSFVDCGFHMSGTRAVSVQREDMRAVSRIFSDVQLAKLLACVPATIVSLVIWRLVPTFAHDPRLFFGVLVYGLFQGLNLYWLFGGLRHQALGSVMDIGAKLTAAIAIFIFVRQPGEAWISLACFAAAQAGWTLAALLIARHMVPFAAFRLRDALEMLRQGRHIFTQHVVGFFYNASSVLLIGIIASPIVVGMFAGAEKIARAPLNPVAPLRQIFFPVISEKMRKKPSATKSLWRLITSLVVLVTTLFAIFSLMFAEKIVRVILGPGFEGAVLPFRILSFLPLIAGLGEMIGTYWLLAQFRDSPLTGMVVTTTVLHVALIAILTVKFGAAGGAAAVMLSQSFALIWTILAMRRPRMANELVSPGGYDPPTL